MQINYSLHAIHDSESFSFCPAAYSRFKFGDEAVAETFGTALARGFIERHGPALLQSPQLVVISSPYCFIPTATFALKNHFVFALNHWLAAHQRPVVQETKIHRTITYKEDYGELDAAERIRLIGNDSFHIDTGFLQGKTLVFLDDIRITGSHERMIHRMIESYGLTNDRFLLYFAELVNPAIHPNVENHLNYHSIKSLRDLHQIVQSDRFAINTRLVKYLLQSPPSLFSDFMQQQSTAFAQLLYNMALGNSYHTIDAYQANLQALRQFLEEGQKIQYTVI